MTLFVSNSLLWASDACTDQNGLFRSVLTNEQAHSQKIFGSLKSLVRPPEKYDVEVAYPAKILDQCQFGTCHMHALVPALEQDFRNRTGQAIKLSLPFLNSALLIERSFKLLNSTSKEGLEISLGSSAIKSRAFLLRVGLIPEDAWRGSHDFYKEPNSKRLQSYLENIVNKARWETQRNSNLTQRQVILERAQRDILNVMEVMVGPAVESFQFQGHEYTAQSFQKRFFPSLSWPMVMLKVSTARKGKTVLEDQGSYGKIISSNLDNVVQTVRDLLDEGQSVYLSYDHDATFVDKKTGIMSISGFHLPPGGGPLSRQQRDDLKMSRNGHAVMIVGYQTDPMTGQIRWFKIKNSWGEKSGDQGYYHMDIDYFRSFATYVSYFDQPHLTPKIEQRKTVQLELPF